MSGVAKAIGTSVNKAARKFGCPMPVSASCGASAGACELRVEDAAVVPATCRWDQLSSRVNGKVSKLRASASQRYGCSTTAPVRCSPDASSGWWSCNEVVPILRQGRVERPNDGSERCSQTRLLQDIAEEVHEQLNYMCPFVASVVCPGASSGLPCRFGVRAGEARTCGKSVQERATNKVAKTLQKARRYGCQTDKAIVCEREEASAWLSCDFSATPALPRDQKEL